MANLRLKPQDATRDPPGFSVLLGGTPAEAADLMRAAFPDPRKYSRLHQEAEVVGSTTADAVRAAGFDLIPVPTGRLPNHGRVVHPEGLSGFTDENLERLAQVFRDTHTPRG